MSIVLRVMRRIRNLIRTVGLLLRVARKSRYPAKMSNDPLRGAVCFVLGNGPSLNTDINEELDIFRTGDTFCVNEFAETDLYKKIQPKYYVFADPFYWSSTPPELLMSSRNRLFGEILNKTSWPLTIYVPFEAEGLFEGVFAHNKNISLSFYNTTEFYGEKAIVNKLYDLGLCMPAPQNVLISALFLSLFLGYKKIILLGADHSWHETLALDDANRVCVKDRHFYNEDAKLTPWSMDGTEENIWTMDAIFHALAKMFEGYWKIEEYAKHLDAEVYNASSVTYIDAFKRMSFSDIRIELTQGVSKDR